VPGKVLLLEFLSANPCRSYYWDTFPHIAGFLRQAGVPCHWLAVPTTREYVGSDFYMVEPPEPDRAIIAGALRDCRPGTVVSCIRMGPQISEAIAMASPGCHVVTIGLDTPRAFNPRARDVLAWIGGRLPGKAPQDLDEPILSFSTPDYGRTVLGLHPVRVRPLISVGRGMSCTFRQPIAANPHFQGLDLSGVRQSMGCSFCVNHGEQIQAVASGSDQEAVARAVGQVQRYFETVPEALLNPHFELPDLRIFMSIDSLAEGLGRAGIPPAWFHFARRLDEVLDRLDALERSLPAFAAAGHQVVIWCAGVENFSQVENQRLNKGLTLETIRRAFGALYSLETRWPDTLCFFDLKHRDTSPGGYFGTIMFTPWTTLDDLKRNAEVLREMSQEIPPLALVFKQLATRLAIYRGTAIQVLAERDGLLAEEFEESLPVVDNQFEVELPWRFRDPGAALVLRLVARLTGQRLLACCRPLPDEEDLRARLEKIRGQAEAGGVSFLGVFELLLDVIGGLRQRQEPLDQGRVLEELSCRLATEVQRDGRAPGDDRSDPAGVGRIGPGPTGGDVHDPGTAEVLSRWLERAIRKLQRDRGVRGFGGYRLAGVEIYHGDVILEWRAATDRFKVCVGRDWEESGAFARSGPYQISHGEIEGRLSASQELILRLVRRLLDRAGGR
jgi:hypothetical protein